MLNPWGDLIAMARSWCLVKPGGFGIVGVPTGPDRIGFNSHKVKDSWSAEKTNFFLFKTN